jgi:hypothetical protein
MTLQVAEAHGPANCRRRGVGEALGEGLTRAGRVQATEPSGLDAQRHRPALPGQVGEGALVAAVHPAR